MQVKKYLSKIVTDNSCFKHYLQLIFIRSFSGSKVNIFNVCFTA